MYVKHKESTGHVLFLAASLYVSVLKYILKSKGRLRSDKNQSLNYQKNNLKR